MIQREWIVCELTRRWAAALRIAIARAPRWPRGKPRLVEVRQLALLTERLEARPDGLALVEARRANFAQTLQWLAVTRRWFREAQLVALIDRDLIVRANARASLCLPMDRPSAADVLQEAGAHEVVISPRQLHPVFALDERRMTIPTAPRGAQPSDVPIADWVWASLPWQDAGLTIRWGETVAAERHEG